jgi:Dimethlysulfonioproprionate lyase
MPSDSSRPVHLQMLIDAARAAYLARVNDPRSRASLAKIEAALGRVGEANPATGARLPVCDHLATVTDTGLFDNEDLRRLVEAFVAIEPSLVWRRRGGDAPSASSSYPDGHANAMILGPAGLEIRNDIWFGVSLLAPNVRYPDHSHAPEETYLVMSAGEFRQEHGPWFAPGVGGSFYNPPGILHAMRSGSSPLLAFWVLRSES